ncbi:response regulator transcription factor [Thermocrinis minervae]|uniref:DNA-binding response regulator, OmpR family, contains REC and winged-helix (WHTH) domain n=1 Tax=Thermocrinis minervae TaxID=381751 RepID=A0A1M6QKA2_9AQUI|nr:response regulator transcription factor [Thermocrinis minervae]SHK20672.1 DNA-binding response regulator, OmpR family, contains REC and winged-helix (wHTH) domain [Thermocrinis minervae]
MKVLLVEDDKLLGESLADYLKAEGIEVDWVSDPRRVLPILEISSYDVIVLDLIMPHIPGEKLLKEIRQKDKSTPILILTAKGRIEDKEVCFREGADDYLVKPFDMKELLLRIRALHRRRVSEGYARIGSVEIDLDADTVKVDGKMIPLSKKDMMLLKLLVQNRGRVVSHEEILNYVWGGMAVGDEVIRSHIKNLRKILPEGFIKTVKGRGYYVE